MPQNTSQKGRFVFSLNHSELGQLGSPWLAELATLAYRSRPVTVPIGETMKQAELD